MALNAGYHFTVLVGVSKRWAFGSSRKTYSDGKVHEFNGLQEGPEQTT